MMKPIIKPLALSIYITACCLTLQAQNTVTFIPPEKPLLPAKRDTVKIAEPSSHSDCFQVFENNILVEEWCMKDNKKNGNWSVYYPGGVLLSMANYIDGKKNGLYIECEKDGAILVMEYYKNDKLNGEQRRYASVKNMRILKSVYNFTDGVKDGVCTDYSDSGLMQSQTTYKTNTRHGKATWYFSNGKLAMEQNYQDNLLNGVQKVYNQQGTLMSNGSYTNNLRSGTWTEYYENGKMKSIGEYVNDKQCGEWKFYNTDGTPAPSQKFTCQ